MAYRFSRDDVAFLAAPAGREAVSSLARSRRGDRLRDVAAARGLVGTERAGAVLETVLLADRAAGRFPAGWLFTPESLEQATALPVAHHRAARVAAAAPGAAVHDVTCSVGVEVAALGGTAGLGPVLGSDLDPVRLAMARVNLRGVNLPGAALVRADARAPVTRDAVLVADPGRRTAGRRVWRPGDFTPPLDALAAAAGDRELVVSTAPGLDPSVAPWAGEVELVSLDGRVREATLWSRGLAAPGVTRRATVLSSGSGSGGSGSGGSERTALFVGSSAVNVPFAVARGSWEVTDADDDSCPVRGVGDWLVDPDGAVVRAGLVRQFAARHGLGQLDPHLAYLTGDRPPDVGRAFRVRGELGFSERALRDELRRRDVGRVEILVRGLDVDPNVLRPRLRLRGSAAATVVLARVGRGSRAYVCDEGVRAD